MKTHRRTPRRGRSLGLVDIGTLLAADPELCGRHAALCGAGFAADPRVRIRRCVDGRYSVRIVWRRRRDGASVVMAETARFQSIEVREGPA